MRTTYTSLLGSIALAALAACTVKDVDIPPLAGPSTFAHSITMVADRTILSQNGLDFTDIRITSTSPTGQPENIPLRAQILVDGVPQDFGTLSTKTPTTPATIRYTAPPPSSIQSANVPQSITIEVTPTNNGDFRSEFARQVELRLVPPGVILPSNPNLVADFTFTPAAPRAFETVTFDATATTNADVACRTNCTYRWNFGDGTSAEGLVVTHQFRSVNTFPVTLTVTDLRGAQAVAIKPVTVSASAPPENVEFSFSPAEPVAGQTVFLNASASRAAPGRTLVHYHWAFGDGTTGGGVTESHVWAQPGTYRVTLTVTDDVGSVATTTEEITIAP